MSKKLTKSKTPNAEVLFHSIASLIEQSRRRVAVAVNTELVNLYWNIGKAIKHEILQNKRAEYGKQIIATLSQQLTENYGSGWSEKQLNHCLRSAETIELDTSQINNVS